MALEAAARSASGFGRAVAARASEAGIGRQIEVTVSAGVSRFGREGDTIDAMLRVAD